MSKAASKQTDDEREDRQGAEAWRLAGDGRAGRQAGRDLHVVVEVEAVHGCVDEGQEGGDGSDVLTAEKEEQVVARIIVAVGERQGQAGDFKGANHGPETVVHLSQCLHTKELPHPEDDPAVGSTVESPGGACKLALLVDALDRVAREWA